MAGSKDTRRNGELDEPGPEVIRDVTAGRGAALGATPYRHPALAGAGVEVGERVALPELSSGGRLAVAFSPDSRLLAFGGAEKVRLWDLRENRPRGDGIQVGIRAAGWLSWLAFSPDGALLAVGCQDHTVRLIEVATGAARTLQKKRGVAHALRLDSDYAQRIAFSPDGALLAAGHEGRLAIWDVASGDEVARLGDELLDVRNVTFSSDGAIACGTSPVLIWALPGGDPGAAELRLTIEPPALVWALAFSPDGRRLATGDGQGRVIVWDAGSGAQLCRSGAHCGDVEAVAFSPSGEVVASYAKDAAVRLWSARDGGQLARLGELPAKDAHAVSFSPDGRWLAAGGLGRAVALWPLRWGVGRAPAPPRSKQPRCGASVGPARALAVPRTSRQHVRFTPDGRQLVAAGGRAVLRWELAALADGVTDGVSDGVSDGVTDGVTELLAVERKIVGLALDPRGDQLAVACEDGTVRLHALAGGAEVRRLRKRGLLGRLLRRDDDSSGLCFAEQGATLAAACGGKVVLWSLPSGRCRTLGSSYLDIRSVASHGALLAAGCASLWVWDLARGARQLLQLDPINTGLVWQSAFSPDGTRLITGDSNGRLSLWELATGEELRRHEGHAGDVYAVAFDPLGELVASYGEDAVVRLWCAQNGALVARLEQVLGVRPVSLAFSPDGRWLAAGAYGDAVTLWPLSR